jgi:hypothetical protein
MNSSLKALAVALVCALPLSAQAVCVLGIGDCGDEFTSAPDYPDCSNLSLQDASGVPDDPAHKYAFTGTCRPKGMHDALIVSTKVSAKWDGATHKASEGIAIAGNDGGTIQAVFTCESDPFIGNASCSLVALQNGTKFNFFTNYISQKQSPVTRNMANLAHATALSKQNAASAPPPPPPPPKTGPKAPTLKMGGAKGSATVKAVTPVPGKPDLTVTKAQGLIFSHCQANQPVLKVAVTVKNVGVLPSPAVSNVGLVTVKEIGGNTNLNGWTGLSAIQPGKSLETAVYIKYPRPLNELAGHHNLQVKLDPLEYIGESNTANNVYAFSVDYPKGYCQTANIKRALPATAAPRSAAPTPPPDPAPQRLQLPARQ